MIEKEVDYSKIDKKVDQIIKKTCIYLKIFDKELIENEIKKAYLYAKEAHE